MLSKGLVLMVLGMAIVFALLVVLIIFMALVRLIVNGGGKKRAALAAAGVSGAYTGNQEIAAIAAAVTVYNKKRMNI